VSGVLANGLQGASHVIADLGITLAFDEQRHLHQSSLKRELVLVDPLQDVRE
jgi:hypothetical protein